MLPEWNAKCDKNQKNNTQTQTSTYSPFFDSKIDLKIDLLIDLQLDFQIDFPISTGTVSLVLFGTVQLLASHYLPYWVCARETTWKVDEALLYGADLLQMVYSYLLS